MVKKYLMAVLLTISILCTGAPSIIIDGGHFTNVGKETPSFVYDGVSVAYLFDFGGKNSLELGGGVSFVSPVSSRDYFQNDFFWRIFGRFESRVKGRFSGLELRQVRFILLHISRFLCACRFPVVRYKRRTGDRTILRGEDASSIPNRWRDNLPVLTEDQA